MNRIYLLGFMGAGKTTIGKALARQLDWTFIDLDHYIEGIAGKQIHEIFSEDGESAFRHLEKRALREVGTTDKAVIGTGGGSPCYFDNMDVIKEGGPSIFLDCPPSVLIERLKDEHSERPILSGLNDRELKEHVLDLLHSRRPTYLQADLVVDASRDVVTVVDELVQWFRKIGDKT